MRTHYIIAIVLAGFLAASWGVFGDDEQTLGKLLFTDPNLSVNRNQSCSTCHSLTPAIDQATLLPFGTPGFVDPISVFDDSPVSAGSVAGDFGSLNAPSVGYAAFS